MIISLQEAKQLDSNITQATLDSYETAVRKLTNNNFQVTDIRSRGFTVKGNTVTLRDHRLVEYLLEDDTVQITDTGTIDGLYTVASVVDKTVTFHQTPRLSGDFHHGVVTFIQYPADIKEGVRRLITYDKNMRGKTGIKSESISRMSLTYYDVNANETVGGYPANLTSFLQKYLKIKWG